MKKSQFESLIKKAFAYRAQGSDGSKEERRMAMMQALDCAAGLLNADERLDSSQLIEVLLEFTPVAIRARDLDRATSFVSKLSDLAEEHEHLHYLSYTALVFNGQILLAEGRVSEAAKLLEQSKLPVSDRRELLIASSRLLTFLRQLADAEVMNADARASARRFLERVWAVIQDQPDIPNKDKFKALLDELQIGEH